VKELLNQNTNALGQLAVQRLE